MLLEEDAQKQCQVLNKVLFVLLAILIGLTDVGAQGKHLGNYSKGGSERLSGVSWSVCTDSVRESG